MNIRTYEYISHYYGKVFRLEDKKGKIVCMEGKKKDMAYIDLLYIVFGEKMCHDIYFSNIVGFSVTWDGNPLLILDLEIPHEYNTQMEDFWWEAEDKVEHKRKNPDFCKMLDSLKKSLCREAQMLECNSFLHKEAC